jgi:hypothetical protein
MVYRAPEMNIPRHYNTTFRADKADVFGLASCLFCLNFLSSPFGNENMGGAIKENLLYRHFFQKDGYGYIEFFNEHEIEVS